MENKNYTIKDIARMAGVSAGTVDRVLHNRGDVSRASRDKVQKVLDEIDYHPNMFAIGLAAKKRYHIVCIIPYYIEHDYWHSVAAGIDRAAQELRPFNVGVDYLFYSHADKASYETACAQLQSVVADGVLIAPNFQDDTLKLTSYLEDKKIPYAFIDFNMEQTHALCYIGQDSKVSGYIAAKILMRRYREGQELALFLNNQKNSPAEVQMQRRLYQVADYLQKKNLKLDALVGYDLLQKNVEYLKNGEVNYLIGQRPGLQGYCGIKALCNHVVFKKPVTAVKYMPIDILMKENIDFYFEFE